MMMVFFPRWWPLHSHLESTTRCLTLRRAADHSQASPLARPSTLSGHELPTVRGVYSLARGRSEPEGCAASASGPRLSLRRYTAWCCLSSVFQKMMMTSSSNFSFLKRKHIDLFRGPDKKRMDCSQKRLSAGIARDPPHTFWRMVLKRCEKMSTDQNYGSTREGGQGGH